MSKTRPKRREVRKYSKLETALLFVSFGFLFSLLFTAIYVGVLKPPVQVWDIDGDYKIKVFDCVPKSTMTIVLSHNEGYKRFKGIIDLEIGAHYRITYMERLGTIEKIVSIEKVSR